MSAEDDPSDQWFRDEITKAFIQLHAVQARIYTGKTLYQAVEILQAREWGKCLVLDGKMQSAELDEFIYHEALVHPALVSHACPCTVFVAGGGEGATLREVLTHRSVQRAVMVDIDAELVSLCRRLLPEWHRGAFDDPRTELLHLDARQYLEDSEERFDAIVVDITDPGEGNSSRRLYTREFYELARSRLTPGGLVAVQGGAANWYDCAFFGAVLHTIRQVFPDVLPYQVHVPSFGGMWGFVLAGSQPDILSLDAVEIDSRLGARTLRPPRSYDGVAHEGMVSLPRHLRRRLSESSTIITDARLPSAVN